MQAPTVTLGRMTVTLARPSALGAVALGRTKEQLDGSDPSLLLSLSAAALAMCWPADAAWPVRQRPRPWAAGQRLEAYGQGVFDALAEEVPVVEIIAAAGEAYRWALTSRLGASDVEAARSFSEAPGAGG